MADKVDVRSSAMADDDSDADEERRRLRRLRIDTAGYGTGYGKPPEHSRFRLGNRGRPRGSKNKSGYKRKSSFLERFYEAANGRHEVMDGGKKVSLSEFDIVRRAFFGRAAKGSVPALREFFRLAMESERMMTAKRDEMLKLVYDYKQDAEVQIARARILGLPEPEIIPHPDHIQFDYEENRVRLTGPLTRADKIRFDQLCGWLRETEEERQNVEADLREHRDGPEMLSLLREDLRRSDYRRALLRCQIETCDGVQHLRVGVSRKRMRAEIARLKRHYKLDRTDEGQGPHA